MGRLPPYRLIFRHRKIAARVLPIVPCSRMSTSRFVYRPIEEVERLEHYRPGGYHPIQIGDCLHGRYRIVHKLGYGSFSTTWLARDRQQLAYVAIKVGTSDSDHHEVDVLSRINDAALECKSRSKPLLPVVLDRFSLRGPNGTHFCLVTNVARCSLADTKEASTSGLFQLQVARALAAQLAIAVARINDQKYVHGVHILTIPPTDLHLGNVLLHLPSGLDHLSEEQLNDKFGAPETEPVVRLDGQPLSPNVPSHAISPVWLGEPSENIVLSDAKLLLVDFGVAFRPSEESRLQSYTPLEIRPPKARFEPTTPLSFASDIWSLACIIWAIIGQRSLFDSLLATQDDITCEQVDALGCLPQEWWVGWGARSRKFTEAGQPVEGRSVWSWDQRFEDSIQEPRREKGMATLDAKEKDAFFAMMRWMLAFRPGDRPTAKQVLETAWMRDWALPEYENISE
ncbi:Protein kinase domain protein [Tolypocladium capitatum]|uniref:non-specific serine/threonine protein kinase n=1 Tax=Tolypocladium capitatum TaxID=45235 RepID=A0A2K3QIF9_9HYPO|nr:Protein kinase domain protein [Tolypocladium capitatum]